MAIWGKFVVKGISSVCSIEPNFESHNLKNYDDSDDDDDDDDVPLDSKCVGINNVIL